MEKRAERRIKKKYEIPGNLTGNKNIILIETILKKQNKKIFYVSGKINHDVRTYDNFTSEDDERKRYFREIQNINWLYNGNLRSNSVKENKDIF